MAVLISDSNSLLGIERRQTGLKFPGSVRSSFLKIGDTLASFHLPYTVWWSILHLKRLVRCGLNAWLADFNSFEEILSRPVALLDIICLICRRTLSSVKLTSESDGTPYDCHSESEDNNGMIEGVHAPISHQMKQSRCSSSKLYRLPSQQLDQTLFLEGQQLFASLVQWLFSLN